MSVRKFFPANAALTDEEALYGYRATAQILAAMRQVIWSMTLGRDKILYLSPSAEQLYGESASVLRDHPNFWLEAIHPEDKAAVWSGMSHLMQTEHTEFVYRIQVEDSSVQWVHHRSQIGHNRFGVAERIDFCVALCDPPKAANTGVEPYQKLFNACGDAMLLRDPTTLKIVEANPAAIRMFGMGSAELCRQRLEELSDRTEGFDSAAEAEAIEAAKKGQIQRYDWQIRTMHDQARWVEITLTIVHLGGKELLLTVLRDSDTRKQQDESRIVAADIIARSVDFVGFANPAGQIASLNPAMQEMLGVRADEVRKLFLTDLLPVWAQPLFLHTCLPLATKNGIWRGELALVGQEGRHIPVILNLLAHKKRGAIKGYSLVGVDISEYKHRENRLLQTKEQLEADNHIRQQMLANVSHGLVPSLNALQNSLSSLTTEDAAKAAANIARAVKQIRTLVDAVIAYTKPD